MRTTVPSYHSPQACRLAGITYRQIDYWARVGLVAPSIAEAAGSGTARRYSACDVLCLRLVGLLTRRGIVPTSCWARDAVEIVRLADVDTLRRGVLVLGDTVPAVLTSDEVASYVERFDDATLLVPLGPLCTGLAGLDPLL